MNAQQMRDAVSKAYSGPDWPYKVKKMPDNQVIALYYRLLKSKKL